MNSILSGKRVSIIIKEATILSDVVKKKDSLAVKRKQKIINTGNTKEKNLSYAIHSLVCLCIMLGFGQLPAVAPLTEHGMRLIGIFLGLLYGWVFVEIIWPSLAGILALMLLGDMTPKEVINTSFGDTTVVMMFFIFVFCAAIDYYGLSRFISMWFITRKFVEGKPWVITFTLMASVAVLGAMTSASPAAVIGWSILYSICELCGYKKGDGYPTMMVLGIVFAAMLGMAVVPFKQVPLTVIGAYENLSGLSVDYGKYMLLAIICCIACMILFIFMGKYIFRPDITKLKNLDTSKLTLNNNLVLNNIQKIVLVFLLLLILLLLLPSFLSTDFFLTQFLNRIGGTGVCVLIVLMMCAIRVNGKPLLQLKPMINNGVAWGIILLLAAVQPLTTAMIADDSGITEWMMNFLNPIFGGKSYLFFLVFIGFVTAVLSNFINHGALGVAMMPIVYSYCTANDLNPQLAVILVVLSLHYAMLTPAAGSIAALLSGNDWMDNKSLWRTGPICILGAWVVVTIITLGIGSLLYL